MVGSTLEESTALTEPLPSTLFFVLMADLRTAFPPHSVVPVAPLLSLSLTSVLGYPVTGYGKPAFAASFGSLFLFLSEVRKREREKRNT